MQQPIKALTLQEQASFGMAHTPRTLMKYAKMPLHSKHYASSHWTNNIQLQKVNQQSSNS
jgi:hypothetical protein